MTVFGYILLFSVIDSVGAILLVSAVLYLPDRIRRRVTSALVTYAIGALLGVTFLDLLPTALERVAAERVLEVVLGGIVLFFVLEKVVIWHHCHGGDLHHHCHDADGRHCHDEDCPGHRTAGPLILIGDGMHNFIDGAIIAAAFLVSVPVGIATSVAVITHEIFQEAGDLAVLVESGYGRRQAILFDIYSGLTTPLGAIILYFALDYARAALPYVLALSVASFLYIALAELLPALPRHPDVRVAFTQFLLLLAGIATIVVVEAAFGI